MGKITELVTSYHKGDTDFEELKQQLVVFPWQEVKWQDRLHKESDMATGAMLTDENMFGPEENTLEELDDNWADDLLTQDEYEELCEAIWEYGQKESHE